MSKRRPDQRYLTIKDKAEVPPEHNLERALWDILHGEGSDPAVSYALEIYSNECEREVMQAWLLARADNAQIEAGLRIPPEVTDAFRHLFFDVGLFRDELDLLGWVQAYEREQQGSGHGPQLFKMAITGGVDALAWLFSRGDFSIDPDKVTKQVMTDTFFRGQANRGHGLASKEAAAAHAFYQTAFKAAAPLTKSGAGDKEDLKIKLLHKEMTLPIEDFILKDEPPLH